MKDKLNNNLETLIAESRQGFPQNSLYILELEFGDFEKFQSGGISPDILGLNFNIKSETEINDALEILKKFSLQTDLPLMLRGSGDDELDKILLPKLADAIDRPSIIAVVNENTYKEIIPHTAKRHFVVLRSPIDINIAKELNILSSELGQPLDKIIIDTDIGGLGYGFEYGYSIIEKIRLEGGNDKYLNMPIISFAAEEALKTKEAKSEKFPLSYGDLDTRRLMFEITSANAVRAAGVNLIVLHSQEALATMKGLE